MGVRPIPSSVHWTQRRELYDSVVSVPPWRIFCAAAELYALSASVPPEVCFGPGPEESGLVLGFLAPPRMEASSLFP